MDNGYSFLLYYSWKKLVPNLKFTPDAVLIILPKSWHIALYNGEQKRSNPFQSNTVSSVAALKLGCLFSLKGDNAEPYGTNKTPLTAGDISRGAVVRTGFSFHSRREECNSSQSSDNNVNVWREVNRRHDVDAWRFHTVKTSHWIWPGNYWSVSKLYYQVPKFPLGGVVWFSSLITLNWFKCVENAPCGSRKSDTMAHLRWSRLEAWRSGKL